MVPNSIRCLQREPRAAVPAEPHRPVRALPEARGLQHPVRPVHPGRAGPQDARADPGLGGRGDRGLARRAALLHPRLGRRSPALVVQYSILKHTVLYYTIIYYHILYR